MRAQSPPPRRRGNRKQSAPRTNKRIQSISQSVRNKSRNSNTTIRKRGNVYYMFHKSRRRIPWRLVIMLLLVFVGAIGSAFSYAQMHGVQRQIAQSRRELNEQQVAITTLNAQVTERYTREEIERLAYERLGMSEPDPSQIIYFHVPHHSHVTMHTSPQPPSAENYFWQSIVAFFNNIFDRFR